MILITGAAGKTGRAVIRALAVKAQTVRGLVHRKEQVSPLKQLGVRHIVVGDMRVQAVMDRAFKGVRTVYHMAPNMHPEEVPIGEVALEAARSAGVEHFVYHSVLHPQTEAMPHHWQKLRVEENLFTSGLPYTILQPAAYMQNVEAHWNHIAKRGCYRVPYSAETRLSMVDLQDVAEVASKVLTESGHEGATYELSGPEVLSQNETAEILEQQLERTVRVEVIPLEVWREQALASKLGDYQIETLMKMFEYYEQNGFWGNSGVLAWLLGRKPTTFAQYVQRTITNRLGT
jgi:uncharacterized protein YbjT (DUF2867 family)